jgi:hypothetical protein
MNMIYMLKTDWTLKTWSSFIAYSVFGIAIIIIVQLITSMNSQTYQKGKIPMHIIENSAFRNVVHAML